MDKSVILQRHDFNYGILLQNNNNDHEQHVSNSQGSMTKQENNVDVRETAARNNLYLWIAWFFKPDETRSRCRDYLLLTALAMYFSVEQKKTA